MRFQAIVIWGKLLIIYAPEPKNDITLIVSYFF